MAKTKETPQTEHNEDETEQNFEMSSDEDEAMNKGNGDLMGSSESEDAIQMKMDPSLESAIQEATLKIIELNEGNSISIRMSNDSSSSASNVISNVNNNSLFNL